MDYSIKRLRCWLAALGFGVAAATGIAPAESQQLCGGVDYPFPYTDVSSVGAAFCPGIMEAYVTGVSKGTTPTTFSPIETVTRVQMTTFLQRSLDQGLSRAGRRAALDQWWTPQNVAATRLIPVGGSPFSCSADSGNIWVSTGANIVQVQASTGAPLSISDPTDNAQGVRIVRGVAYVADGTSPGALYVVDPSFVTKLGKYVNAAWGNQPVGLAFDGANFWTANRGPPGSVTIFTADTNAISTVTTGFNAPYGILYDGAYIWVTDTGAGALLKLDSSGNILQTVTVGSQPALPIFDGVNIWVPNFGDNSITVVQASTGKVVNTINSDTSNQLNGPNGASFDGERILIANYVGNSVSLFKAADLSFIANVSTGPATQPTTACGDGINFWVPLQTTGDILQF